MITIPVGRRLLVALSPITGQRSSGTVLVTPTGADVTLDPGTWLAPLVSGSLDMQRLAYVSETTVVSGPTAVPVRSMNGGAIQNLPAGDWRFIDEPAGIEPIATAAAPFSGGSNGMAKEAVLYEQISQAASRDLFLGKVNRYPAIVLGWDSTGGYSKQGAYSQLADDRWTVYVVASRQDSTERRASEAMAILDECEERLVGRVSFDQLKLSAFPIQLRGRGRRAVDPAVLVYTLTFSCFREVSKTDTTGDIPSFPWETSLVEVNAPVDVIAEPKNIDSIVADMVP